MHSWQGAIDNPVWDSNPNIHESKYNCVLPILANSVAVVHQMPSRAHKLTRDLYCCALHCIWHLEGSLLLNILCEDMFGPMINELFREAFVTQIQEFFCHFSSQWGGGMAGCYGSAEHVQPELFRMFS